MLVVLELVGQNHGEGKSVDIITLVGQVVEKGEPVDVYIGPSVTKPWWGKDR